MKYSEILKESIELKMPTWDEDTRPIDVEKYLLSSGYKQIGSGDYSSVFYYPGSDTVIKVRSDLGSEAKPTREVKFYKLCLKSSNPYLPKILMFNRIDKDWYVAEIEKLSPLTPEYEELVEDMVFNKYHSSDEDFISYFNNITTEDKTQMLLGLREAIEYVINNVKANSTYLDIKNIDNFMMRGNQLVIIDPYR